MVLKVLIYISLLATAPLNARPRKFKVENNKIKAEIKKIELSLSRKNKNYVMLIKVNDKISEDIRLLKKKINIKNNKIIKVESKISKKIKGIVLLTMQSRLNVELLALYKVSVKNYKKEILYLKFQKNKMLEDKNKLNFYKKKSLSQINESKDLLTIISSLENKKVKLTKNYYQNLQKRSLKTFKKVKRKLLKRRKGYLSPILSYDSIEHKKKGVTFIYSKKQGVLATKAGKVVYVGSLSKYGNVVMIDHNKIYKSVFLGNFKPKVIKGNFVKKGTIIGNSLLSNLKEGRIYYEIRKNNKALNTLNLLALNK